MDELNNATVVYSFSCEERVGGTFKSRSEEIKKVGWVDTLIDFG